MKKSLCENYLKKASLLACLLFGSCIWAMSQQISVSGSVKDPAGEPLPGVSISIQGTAKGTVSDANGAYTIDVPGAQSVLQFSYIGYVSQSITVGNCRTIDVVLEDDTKTLEEVVVVGFGTQKKVNMTGAVDVVTSKQLVDRPVANLSQALQGTVPGLQIANYTGTLDGSPSVNIRGTTTIGQGTSGNPLILIDGMEGDLNSLNPQDIEAISVLKDAAASSIYGSCAPFGVILITTKSGKGHDGNVTVNYNNNFRVSAPIRMNKMMNSLSFATWMNDTYVNSGYTPYFPSNPDNSGRFDQILEYHNAKPYGPGSRITGDGEIIYSLEAQPSGQWYGGFSRGIDDIDWFDFVYKDRRFAQEHNLSVSGGTRKFNYYLSGSFLGEDGFLDIADENLARYTVTTKINSQLTDWMKLNYTIRFTREDYNRPSAANDDLYARLGSYAWPVLPAYTRNGDPFYSDDTSVWNLKYGGNYKKQEDNIYNQLGIVLEPVKNWITTVDFNYRSIAYDTHTDYQKTYQYDINGSPHMRRVWSGVGA
jgi:TonB-linked SusC/RagA family outer membrane protein